jgi:hypothetical protein
VERTFASQCLGIHPSSDSCELVVATADLGTVAESMSRASVLVSLAHLMSELRPKTRRS